METTFDFGDGVGPVPAHQHPNGGGWVANSVRIDLHAFVDRNARVFQKAIVGGGTIISGKAQVFGYALVMNDAIVTDNAQVGGVALVSTGGIVEGDVLITGPENEHLIRTKRTKTPNHTSPAELSYSPPMSSKDKESTTMNRNFNLGVVALLLSLDNCNDVPEESAFSSALEKAKAKRREEAENQLIDTFITLGEQTEKNKINLRKEIRQYKAKIKDLTNDLQTYDDAWAYAHATKDLVPIASTLGYSYSSMGITYEEAHESIQRFRTWVKNQPKKADATEVEK